MDHTTLEENMSQRNETMRSRRTDPRVEGLPRSMVDVDATSATHYAEAPSQQHIIRIRVGVLIMCLFFGELPIPATSFRVKIN